MGELVEYFIRSRNFILFALLEILCFYCINTSKSYQASSFNTTNEYAAQLLNWSNAYHEFSQLRQVHTDLRSENQRLRHQLGKLNGASTAYPYDTSFHVRFEYIVGKVIKTNTQSANNDLTIDKGTDDGIRPGMSVITPKGIVGKINRCSPQFSVVTSILNTSFLISSRLIKANDIGTARWDGIDSHRLKLNDISLNNLVSIGDCVVTSEQNSAFPSGILIGRVQKIGKQSNLTFYDLAIDLSENLSNLPFVYIIKSDSQSSLKK
jgi:rod shape-determining protein MreC